MKQLKVVTTGKRLKVLVTPAGFEPAISWMKTKYPRPLDDGATK